MSQPSCIPTLGLTVGEEILLAGGVLVEVLLEGRVLSQARVCLKAKKLGREGTLRHLEVRVVELEPLLRPALSARHADACGVIDSVATISHAFS